MKNLLSIIIFSLLATNLWAQTFKSGDLYYRLVNTEGNELPDTTGWNIPAGALTIAQAREICSQLESEETTGTQYYVMGYVKKIHIKHAEGISGYGNAQFYMEDVKGANSQNDFLAYQVYGLEGKKINNPDAVAVGDFVVIYGELTNYMDIYETVGKGAAYIWKSTNPLLAESSVGETGGTEDSGNTEGENSTTDSDIIIPENAIIFDADTDQGNAIVYVSGVPGQEYTVTKEGITMTVSSGYLGTNNNEMHYRIFKHQTLTITSTRGNIKEIVFTCKANNDEQYGPGCFSFDSGEYVYSGANGQWKGDASEVVFTAATNQVRATQIAIVVDNASYTTRKQSASSDEQLPEYYAIVTRPTDAYSYSLMSVEIPATVEYDGTTYPVTGIDDYAFSQSQSLQSVTLSENISRIGSHAFAYLPSLTSIVVPASVTSFGAGAFADNYNLTHFEYLGTEAEYYNYDYPILYNCNNLRYFKGTQDMVWYWDNLDTVIITSGEGCGYYEARYIDNSSADDWYIEGDYAANVVEVETLILQNGLQEIGNYALYNARYLEQITIPAGVTRIGESAFEECRSLEAVTFAGRALREIDDWAFYNCHSLRRINIPEGVTSIGKAAFFNCTYLNEMTLPSTMQTIADNAFSQCQKVSKITVNAMIPPVVKPKTFEDIDRNIPLYVPAGTASQYKQADYWCEFFNVIEQDALSSVENLNAPSPTTTCQKILRNGQLIILRDGKTYTTMGAEIQ